MPKEKNSASFRDLVGEQRGARKLDHGANDVVELRAGLLDDLVGDAASGVFKDLELLFVENERMHDLRQHFNALLLDTRWRLR